MQEKQPVSTLKVRVRNVELSHPNVLSKEPMRFVFYVGIIENEQGEEVWRSEPMLTEQEAFEVAKKKRDVFLASPPA